MPSEKAYTDWLSYVSSQFHLSSCNSSSQYENPAIFQLSLAGLLLSTYGTLPMRVFFFVFADKNMYANEYVAPQFT